MPQLTLEQEQELGLVPPPPGVPEVEPETKLIKLAKVDVNSYRQLMELTKEQKDRIKTLMKNVFEEWKRNTRLQNDKILRNIDRFEGITGPKEYPWPEASNLNIPYSEIQVLIAYDLVCATVIDADPMYFLRELLPARKGHPEEAVDPKIEHWLNWVFKKQLHLDEDQRMAVLLAFRDPVSFLCMDWVQEIGTEYRVQVFEDAASFQGMFPTSEKAGIPEAVYNRWLGQLGIAHEPIALEITEKVVKFRGPKARVVELKDFVRVPVSCPDLKYTVFHGDQFRQRRAWYKYEAKIGHYYEDETEELLKASGATGAIDAISQELDTIEGISSNRLSPDEFDSIRGNLRIDLNDDGEEELYHVVYNPDHDRLLRVERYPYWHNRSNYIPHRVRRKPNRLLGRCFMDMLFDINESINSIHNVRADSKTITTVPSFKIHNNETDLISMMDRKDQHFFPGCRFVVTNMNNLAQLDTKVDYQGNLEEETHLFAIGEMLSGTGASSARGVTPRDPRASGKKKQIEIGQSNMRIDGYIRELTPSFRETASQVLEHYYQFSPTTVLDYATYDASTDAWVRNEIQRVSLRNRNMTIELARTSVLDNPDAVLQRALTDYEIWSKEPLVGGNIERRHELIRSTMFAERKSNISKLLPPLKKILEEMQNQDALAAGSPSHQALLESVHEKTGKPKKQEPSGRRQGNSDLRPSQLNRSQKGM
jgi:hypothetical protein